MYIPIYIYIYVCIDEFPEIGIPPKWCIWMVGSINHPAIGVPPFMETFIWGFGDVGDLDMDPFTWFNSLNVFFCFCMESRSLNFFGIMWCGCCWFWMCICNVVCFRIYTPRLKVINTLIFFIHIIPARIALCCSPHFRHTTEFKVMFDFLDFCFVYVWFLLGWLWIYLIFVDFFPLLVGQYSLFWVIARMMWGVFFDCWGEHAQGDWTIAQGIPDCSRNVSHQPTKQS